MMRLSVKDDKGEAHIEAEAEGEADTAVNGAYLKQALGIEAPVEDGAWLKSMFRLVAVFLELAYGSKKEANRALPWLLFSLGLAYERYHIHGAKNWK